MKEEDIRKRSTFDKYLDLVRDDVKEFFDYSMFEDSLCPVCESHEYRKVFSKNEFVYVRCCKCNTLYVKNRPPFSTLNDFYSSSASTDFWVREFFMPVAEVRREKIFKPRAEYIHSILKGDEKKVADIGAGFGIFLEELIKLNCNIETYAIEPSSNMAQICRGKSLNVEEKCLEELDDGVEYDFVTAFELVEHIHTPKEFFKSIYDKLRDNGRFLFTTLNGEGFDILILGEKSKSVFPPHHLNFFNPVSIKMLLKDLGFKNVTVDTPGCLDWDIVEGMIKQENVFLGEFWDKLVECPENTKIEFQNWIKKSNLSSHMRVIAEK